MILLLLVISIIFISPEKIQGTLITFSLWKRNYVGFMFWLLHPDQTSTTNQTTKPNHHITKLNFSDLITHCVCHLERRSPKTQSPSRKLSLLWQTLKYRNVTDLVHPAAQSLEKHFLCWLWKITTSSLQRMIEHHVFWCVVTALTNLILLLTL